MWRRWQKPLLWGLTATGGLLMAASGVGPEQAFSNLSAWAVVLGIESVPEWLTSKEVDKAALIIGLIVFMVAFGLLVWQRYRRDPKRAILIAPLILITVSTLGLTVGVLWYVTELRSQEQQARSLEQQETGTYVKLKMSGAIYDFVDSNNVSSIDDIGTGDISINFTTPLDPENMIVSVTTGEGSIDYKVVEKTAGSVRLQFHAYEPSVVKIEIED